MEDMDEENAWVYFTGNREMLKKKFFVKSPKDDYVDSLQKKLDDFWYLVIRTDDQMVLEHFGWDDSKIIANPYSMMKKYLEKLDLPYELRYREGYVKPKSEAIEMNVREEKEHWGS